jgi:hypothetical protein
MKTLIVLVLMLLGTASVLAFNTVSLADVTSAVSHARTAEPARLLVCGATLLVLSVAARRATFDLHKRQRS